MLTGRFGEAQALERAARDLLEELKGTDRAGELAQAHAHVAEQVSALRQDRADAERRTEALLQGMQDVLNRLIDRLPRDDPDPSSAPARRAPDSAVPGARVADPALLAALDELAPRSSRARLASAAGSANVPAGTEEELLLEPGAAAPQRPRAGDDPADPVRSRTNTVVSAHIAAARRAAQSAAAEDGGAKSPGGWPGVEKNFAQAKRFCVRRRRALLLAAALVLAVAAAARYIETHGILPQNARLASPAADKASEPVIPPAAVGAAPRSIDATPTGSIGRAAASNSAEIPSGAPAALREAVAAGSPPAQYELAQRLLEGRGLPQDPGAAAFWFERAAKAGFAPAAFRLGAMDQKGAGVQRDLAEAKRWYTAAAEAGNARAAHNLGVMEAEPVGEKADYAEAVKWFRGGENGRPRQPVNLAVLYARGLGVPQDLRQSWFWFSLAAAQGDAEAGKKRDEVAGKMDPEALAATRDLLSSFKATEPNFRPPTNPPRRRATGGTQFSRPSPLAPKARDRALERDRPDAGPQARYSDGVTISPMSGDFTLLS